MRLRLLKFSYLFLLGLIIVRLFYWQIFRFDDLSARADSQHLTNRTVEGERGSILFSDGSPLTLNRPSYLLYGLPQAAKNKAEIVSKLARTIVHARQISDKEAEFLEINGLKTDLQKKLDQDLSWVSLYKDLTLETKQEIDSLKLDGISFDLGSARYYPEASMAAKLLGFVGSDSTGRQTGYFGLEGFYNGQLKGVKGALTEETDALGLPILMGTFLKRDPKQGNSLVLTIDRTAQFILEDALKEGIEKYGAKSASALVMDPHTGEVLAMASFPSYDPGDFTNFPKDYYKNQVVGESFEPGSTFKVLSMAAAINENLVKSDTKCDDCSGPVEVSGYLIRTWNNKYQPELTMTDAIVHSDNTGMVFIGKKLGVDKMFKYIQDFGFGSLSGIDLQDEASPDIRPKKDWREIDLATSSFGQGIAVTDVQLVRAVSVIANGGNLMEPHVVKEIKNGAKLIKVTPKVTGRPITAETAKTMAQMMVEAVEKGEAKAFAPKGYKIAGKTGTAQIPVAGHYDPTKTIASFIGFAPADNPKFVMLVRYVEPSASIFGAETAAPTFFKIAKQLMLYFNVLPN